MHGLNTIRQLNELAAHNAPGAAEKLLEAADASRRFNPSAFDVAVQAELQERKVRRAEVITHLTNKSVDELVSIVRCSTGSTASPIEEALANKLEAAHARVLELENDALNREIESVGL